MEMFIFLTISNKKGVEIFFFSLAIAEVESRPEYLLDIERSLQA